MTVTVLAKGALVVQSASGGLPSFLWFQYNPESLSRTLKPSIAGGEKGSRSEAVRLTGPPTETIDVEVVFDASTAPMSVVAGVAPYIAALELLLYPKSTHLVADAAKLKLGTIEVEPAEAPLVLFSWGIRLIPVVLESYSIKEQAFDQFLNPMAATATLSLRVLSAADISPSHKGYKFYLFYQKSREVLSKVAIAGWLNLIPRR